MRTREAIGEARKMGYDAGRSAASWAFRSETPQTYAEVLKGIEDGDPAILDSFRVPNLSGEFADDPTPRSLVEDIGIAEDDKRLEWLESDLCSVWEEAASASFWFEIERTCREMVSA